MFQGTFLKEFCIKPPKILISYIMEAWTSLKMSIVKYECFPNSLTLIIMQYVYTVVFITMTHDGDGLGAAELESDRSKALTSACRSSNRRDDLLQSENAAEWLTPKSCANEMKSIGVSVDWTQVIGPPSRAHEDNMAAEIIPVLRWGKITCTCLGED